MNVILMIVTLTGAVSANTPPISNVEFHRMPSINACLQASEFLNRDARRTLEIIQESFNSSGIQRGTPGTGAITAFPPAFPPFFSRSTRCIEG
jgi:hypothetical protein